MHRSSARCVSASGDPAESMRNQKHWRAVRSQWLAARKSGTRREDIGGRTDAFRDGAADGVPGPGKCAGKGLHLYPVAVHQIAIRQHFSRAPGRRGQTRCSAARLDAFERCRVQRVMKTEQLTAWSGNASAAGCNGAENACSGRLPGRRRPLPEKRAGGPRIPDVNAATQDASGRIRGVPAGDWTRTVAAGRGHRNRAASRQKWPMTVHF